MEKITRLEISQLHGSKDVDLRIEDNTLILVGENGAGKTTVLNLLYYVLSGQWLAMTKYQFREIAITIDSKRYVVPRADLEKSFHKFDKRLASRFPPNVRRRFLEALEQKRGVTGELESLCMQYGIPISYLVDELGLFDGGGEAKASGPIRQTMEGISKSLGAQLLYLPTYRRIEQELNLIFHGLDEREIKNRRDALTARRGDGAFVELVEFGMKDVENAIQKTLLDLSTFARESLNNLTFGYLGDIVEKQYANVDLDLIKNATEESISEILGRIQDHILSVENKEHLKELLAGFKATAVQSEHTMVISHYFTKLIKFHAEIKARESSISAFCSVCNEYMGDKQFVYDNSTFSFTIIPKSSDNALPAIELYQLSSGEKQIVSLFSHLYLSGGNKYFVLIDEPELSLSVPWQRRFLSDISNAGFFKGLVAVTHSPFIYDNELRKYAHGLGEFVL